MIRLQPMIAAAGVLAAVCMSAAAAQIDAADLYDLPAADVVILGEIHDNPTHHAHQAIVLGAIGARAVVFEMLDEAQAAKVTPQLLRSQEALAAVLGWAGSGWPDFAMYYPVFVAGADARVLGGAVDIDRVRLAMTKGAAAVFGEGAAALGLDTALDPPEQLARESGQFEAHCGALPEAMLPGMVEAQRLRDAGLARAVLAALASVGPPVAVITGNGHARTDWGLPRMLRAALPGVTILSVGQFEVDPGADAPYDYWLVTDAAVRDEDPCAAFADR